jgi:phospholipid/cholesterol/gamma-HCH transport system substrate-binding protein
MTSWLGSPEFKVGALVLAVSVLIGGMAMKVAEGPGMLSGQKEYYFKVDSAGGLVRNSAVKMAGIKVGIIDDIILEDGRAKVVIALERDTRLTQSS